MVDPIPRLEILLGLLREKIPTRFERTFEGRPFDTCSYCGKPLRAPDCYYLVTKYYSQGELQAEVAICQSCRQGMKLGYSQESLRALEQIYGADYQARRFEVLEAAGAEERIEKMLANCALCGRSRAELETWFEYALCEGEELIFLTQPSMVCEACTIRVNDQLSEETRRHKRRFFDQHFGFPPPEGVREEWLAVMEARKH